MPRLPQTCSNPDCNVAEDGKCLEGLEQNECPHIDKLSVEDIEEIEEAEGEQAQESVASPDPTIALESGDALYRRRASQLQRRRVSRCLGLIGPHDAGKTSLIAGLFDLFQQAPVNGVSFAGSSTLIGFEKACHDARAASRRTVPHTERTTVGADATFFHLDLHKDDVGLISLFIGDRSGEDYLAMTDELTRADEFFELLRADCITLLVNGEQLANSETRHEAKAVTPNIVDALVEATAIRKGCRFALVLTKKDSVLSSPNSERVQREFASMFAGIVDKHDGHFGEMQSFVVAASPRDCDQVQRGEGVGDLLHFWLGPVTPPLPIGEGSRKLMPRMIDRFSHQQDAEI